MGSVKYKFIEFFVFDSGSFPCLLSVFLVRSYFSFAVVALYKIFTSQTNNGLISVTMMAFNHSSPVGLTKLPLTVMGPFRKSCSHHMYGAHPLDQNVWRMETMAFYVFGVKNEDNNDDKEQSHPLDKK